MQPLRLTLGQLLCRPLPPLIAQRLRTYVYPLRRAYRDDFPFTVRSQTGSWFKSRTGIFQAWPFSVHGYYDWRNVAIAQALAAPGDTIVEVGANIGTETVCYSDIVGPRGKVCAFEPVPGNAALLDENLSLSRFRNVEVFPYAVADACKPVRFALPKARTNLGDGFIASTEDQARADSVEVECVTLDSMADRIGLVQAIFME